jgi:hypothetical protein
MSDRSAADHQMRERFDALTDQLTIGTLYGISALGTKLCVYTYDSATEILEPECIERDRNRVNDRASAARWNHDIMTHEGEQRFGEIATHIKAMCNQL